MRSSLPALSHGCEAIRESLIRIEPLLVHEGLAAWYIRMAVPLVAFMVLFISRRASLTSVPASVSSGAFRARGLSFGRRLPPLLCTPQQQFAPLRRTYGG